MVEHIHLKNAPITEALIDIYPQAPKDIDLAKLESLHDSIKDEYPIKEQRRIIEGKIRGNEKGITEVNNKAYDQGFWFKTQNGDQIFQARVDGFTFNRLKPYETWEKVRDEARKLWSNYAEVVKPGLIGKVGLRYINHIEIPLPVDDLLKYIKTVPQVPKGLPQNLIKFFTQTVIRDNDSGIIGVTTQALEQTLRTNKSILLLDIEVSFENNEGLDQVKVWSQLEELHTFKNEIFFNSITEKVVNLCQ